MFSEEAAAEDGFTAVLLLEVKVSKSLNADAAKGSEVVVLFVGAANPNTVLLVLLAVLAKGSLEIKH